MTTVAVIDYGMGNLRSVAKALEHVSPKTQITVTSEPEIIARADKIVFPGQGAMGHAMEELHQRGLVEVILKHVYEKPFLGICLGLQALLESSAEDGGTKGLGMFAGKVLKFSESLIDKGTDKESKSLTDGSRPRLKVPHMGWNQAHQMADHPLWKNIPQDSRFYFVHSYYVQPSETANIAASTRYGVNFASAVSHQNIFAVQFHPEKSQHAGLTLLENFIEWDGQN